MVNSYLKRLQIVQNNLRMKLAHCGLPNWIFVKHDNALKSQKQDEK